MDRASIAAVRRPFERAIAEQTLPGAVIGAATGTRVLFREALGFRQVRPDSLPMTVDTRFDLASLTKVVATTSIFFRLLERGEVRLDDLVSSFLGGGFGTLRLRHLLTHTSGFPAWLDLGAVGPNRDQRLAAIRGARRLSAPGERVLYSDLNFIALGYILEGIAGQGLDQVFVREVQDPLQLSAMRFLPPPDDGEFAATEADPATGRPWLGVVHDENARSAGGVSGHAGLFGTLDDLLRFGQALLNGGVGPRGRWLSAATVDRLLRAETAGVPGELRALGYQKPFPLSSAGDLMSPRAIGHTGFTGTSLWIDFEYGVSMVALTNRVHFGREINAPLRLRPIFHNVVLAHLDDL